MKKHLTGMIVLGLLLSLIICFNVQAQGSSKDKATAEGEYETIILLPPGQNKSTDRQDSYARGSIISTAIAEISNAGNGEIEILLETLAHHQCDKIRHVGYLERWIEEDQDYEQVGRYEFVEYASDHPGESFTGMAHSFIVKDQPAGYYYRVRGTHNVYSGGETEGLSTRTDGVMITKE